MDQLHDHPYRLHIEGLVSLSEFAQPLTQCDGRTVSEILLDLSYELLRINGIRQKDETVDIGESSAAEQAV